MTGRGALEGGNCCTKSRGFTWFYEVLQKTAVPAKGSATRSTCTWCRLRTCHWQQLAEPRDLNNLDMERTAGTKEQGDTK
jgi:hypothetical protein